MKIQKISLSDPLLLRRLVFDQLQELPGRIELLEDNLVSEFGSLCLGIDEERRFVLIHIAIQEESSLLVKILSQMRWLVRYHALLSRLYSNQGVVFPQSPRAIVISPSFSAPLKEAVAYMGVDIELHRYQALEIDRQTALLLDSVWIPAVRSVKPAVPVSPTTPSATSRIELTDEERNFFEGSAPKNQSV